MQKKSRISRHYKKNLLKFRIERLMRFTNGFSTLLLLVAMTMVLGVLISLIGSGFTQYTANQIASKIQQSYDNLENKDEFKDIIKYSSQDETINAVDIDDYTEMTEEEMNELKEVWDDFEQVQGIHKLNVAHAILRNMVYFEYEIHYKNRILYNSMDDGRVMNTLEKVSYESFVSKMVSTNSVAFFTNEDGEVIGDVSVTISQDIINMIYATSIGMAVLFFFVMAIISRIVSQITSRIVARPLETLASQMEDMANDELEDAFNKEIKVKRPVSEIVSLTESTSKILKKMSHYYELMTAQNEELEAQRDELESQRDLLGEQKDELEAQNEVLSRTSKTLQSLNSAYLNRSLKLQNLLDNTGQGFMSFGKDLKIKSEYSLACKDMLCEKECAENETSINDIAGMKVTDLIFGESDQKDFIEELLIKIIEGTDHERSLFIPLLPDEIVVQGRTQQIDYKIVKDEQNSNKILVILTDITQTRVLEKQMSQEQDILKMIVKVLLNREACISLIKEFEKFVNDGFTDLEEKDYESTLRRIHTFKGSFSQYYMNGIGRWLDEAEGNIYEVGTMESIKSIAFEEGIAKLQEDIKKIEGYIGEAFLFEQETYTIREEKVIEIEQKIKRLLPASEFNKVIPIIKSIRYKSVKDIMKTYPDYVEQLSERMGKSIMPFEIEGEDVFLDYDIYQDVFKNMVHLFRNAVDHGIEDSDTRVTNNKSISATIRCQVQSNNDDLKVIVEDDGSGISKDVLDKIFEDGFTTKTIPTAISGRGMGLSALKSAVEDLRGTIEVESIEGEGSKFIVTLPLVQGTDITYIESQKFIEYIHHVSSDYFKSLSLDIGVGRYETSGQIMLHEVNALLNMKGSIDGMLIVSANKKFAKDLVNAFLIEKVEETDEINYAEDVLGEVTNTILGNVLGELENEGIYLNMGIPVMLSNDSAYIKYSDRNIVSIDFEDNNYQLKLSLLITEGHPVNDHLITEGDAIMYFLNKEGGDVNG